MGATFPRIKNWGEEILTNEDLNAEIDNILDNFVPLGMDDYSVNVVQMQIETDPGEVSSESLAVSLGGELERLRFTIAEVKGTTNWYETAASSIAELVNLIGDSFPPNRISSGSTISASNTMSNFLNADGVARTLNVDGSPTPLAYVIEGSAFSISSDTTITNLQAAPSSNNTALVNDATLSDQDFTRDLGQNGTTIPIDTVGSQITALDGKIAAFLINNGSLTEQFIARVNTTSGFLEDCRRGYFLDSSDSDQPAIVFSDGDTITLLRLTWVFANTALGLEVTYNQPRYSGDEPAIPAIGDFWFDLTNAKWMTFESTAFVDSDATLVGICVQDTTATTGARSLELPKAWDDFNSVGLIIEAVDAVRGDEIGAEISVNGISIRYTNDYPRWNFSDNLESGEAETVSTQYYLYIDEFGDSFMSTKTPNDRRGDLKGFYHPDRLWRAVGYVYNDASGNLTISLSYAEGQIKFRDIPTKTASAILTIDENLTLADSTAGVMTITLPPTRLVQSVPFEIKKISADFDAITIATDGSETVGGAASTAIHTDGETLFLFPNKGDWIIQERRIPDEWESFTPTGAWTTNTTWTGQRKRVGDSWVFNVKAAFAGAPEAVEFAMDIPESQTVAEAKLALDPESKCRLPGGAHLWNDNISVENILFPSYAGTDTEITLWRMILSTTYQYVALTRTAPATIAASDSIQFNGLRVPITGWNG